MRIDTNIAGRLMSDLMRDFGLTRNQAAGFVGNLAHESGGFKTLQERNPTVKGSRGGYGYAQWTGSRRRSFESWAKARNLSVKSYEANYGFLKHELTKTPEKSVLSKLKNAKTVAQASKIVMDRFLRPGVKATNSRKNLSFKVRDLNAGAIASLSPEETPVPTPSPAILSATPITEVARQSLGSPIPNQAERGLLAGLFGQPQAQAEISLDIPGRDDEAISAAYGQYGASRRAAPDAPVSVPQGLSLPSSPPSISAPPSQPDMGMLSQAYGQYGASRMAAPSPPSVSVDVPQGLSLPSSPPTISAPPSQASMPAPDQSRFGGPLSSPQPAPSYSAQAAMDAGRFAPPTSPAPPGGALGYGAITPSLQASPVEETSYASQSESVTDEEYAESLSQLGLSASEVAMAVAARSPSKAAPTVTTPAPAPAPVAQPAPVPAPALSAPRQVADYRTPAPAPAPPTGADFWAGRSNYGVANNGVQLSRDELGRNVMTSPAGQTTVQLDSGHWAATGTPFGIGKNIDVQTPQMPSRQSVGKGLRTGLGAGAGGLLGSVLGGPIGGLLGAVVGRSLAQGRGLLGQQRSTPGFGGGNITNNAFPSRPDSPAGGGGGEGYSQADIGRAYGLSPSLGDAVSRGVQGLW
jgi:hypothetical protein